MHSVYTLFIYLCFSPSPFYTNTDWIFVPESSLYQFTRLEAFSSFYLTSQNTCVLVAFSAIYLF